jgi:hypothetical protein
MGGENPARGRTRSKLTKRSRREGTARNVARGLPGPENVGRRGRFYFFVAVMTLEPSPLMPASPAHWVT